MSFKKINLTRAKKLKNHLFLCTVFNFLFFISSCTKEDITEEIKDEVITTPNSITGKHYHGKEAFNFVNEKKLNEIIGSGQYRDEYAFTIDYSEVIQVIEDNVGENITVRVNHPNQKPFMFYNLVISTSLNGTTARLLEYTMTPRFFNSYSSGLTTIQEFEGLVLSQLMYTSYPCQDEEDEMLIIAPYGDYNLVDPATGTTSGINLINTGFLSGTYSGTMFSGPSAAGPSSGGGASGSGGTNDPNIFPNFTDGLDNFFNSIGSAFSDAYEWTGNTIRTIFRWIRNLFCGSCGPRLSMARGPANPITIIDDNAPPASTPAPLESCDWFYTNFALFHVNTLVGYNPNTNLTPTVLNWWDLTASKAVKVSLLNFLYRNPTISQNTWEVFFQIVDYLMNGGDTSVVQSFLNIAKLSDLNLNFYYSLSSPANIDDSAIDKTTPEGQKFDCIYKILMQSPSFKNLFNDTFGGNQSKLNVKFEIADNLPASTSGVCILLSSNNGNHSNLIRINKNILAGTNVKSNFKIAKTILHECIHAYLNIKKINCNLGSNIDELNGLDLQELIGTFYQSFGCHIDVNGSPQSQHEFMFNHLVPTFQNIFSEIRDLLASQSSINYVSNSTYVNSINNQNFSWNWNDFYKYFSLEGLHQCESFVQNIAQVPLENFYYEFYRTEAQQFSKDCQ